MIDTFPPLTDTFQFLRIAGRMYVKTLLITSIISLYTYRYVRRTHFFGTQIVRWTELALDVKFHPAFATYMAIVINADQTDVRTVFRGVTATHLPSGPSTEPKIAWHIRVGIFKGVHCFWSPVQAFKLALGYRNFLPTSWTNWIELAGKYSQRTGNSAKCAGLEYGKLVRMPQSSQT